MIFLAYAKNYTKLICALHHFETTLTYLYFLVSLCLSVCDSDFFFILSLLHSSSYIILLFLTQNIKHFSDSILLYLYLFSLVLVAVLVILLQQLSFFLLILFYCHPQELLSQRPFSFYTFSSYIPQLWVICWQYDMTINSQHIRTLRYTSTLVS